MRDRFDKRGEETNLRYIHSSVRRRAPVVVAFLAAVPWFLAHGGAWRGGGQIPADSPPPTLLWEHRAGEPGKDDFVRGDANATGGDAVFVAGSCGNDFLVQAYSADDGRLPRTPQAERSCGKTWWTKEAPGFQKARTAWQYSVTGRSSPGAEAQAAISCSPFTRL